MNPIYHMYLHIGCNCAHIDKLFMQSYIMHNSALGTWEQISVKS